MFTEEKEEKVEVKINHNKVQSLLWNDVFLPTNKWIQINVSDALRLARIYPVEFTIPTKSYNPETYIKDKIFGLTGDADTKSGYGNCTVNLVTYSLEKGYDVRWIGKNNYSPFFRNLAQKPIPLDIAMVWHEQPKSDWLKSPFAKNIAITPFETTRIPRSWVPLLNTMDAVFVPCKQNIQMMKDSGVRVPIELIKWGVDETKWYPVQRNNKVFTFGTMGALSLRKGTDILTKAFQLAFPKDKFKDVRLIAKTSYYRYDFWEKDDPRIIIQMTPVEENDLLNDFVKQVDCFVFPTRGEGFGLPPLEMMATGVPAIVTNWSGPADYINDEVGYPLNDYKMVPADSFTKDIYKEDCGYWAEPSVDELVEKMRYCYYHPDEVKKKGEKAAEYVKNNWLWKDVITYFHNALDKHLKVENNLSFTLMEADNVQTQEVPAETVVKEVPTELPAEEQAEVVPTPTQEFNVEGVDNDAVVEEDVKQPESVEPEM